MIVSGFQVQRDTLCLHISQNLCFTKERIKELAAEIVEWHDTSLLKIGGRVRELAQILQTLDKSKSLSIAENMINREALKIVANQ